MAKVKPAPKANGTLTKLTPKKRRVWKPAFLEALRGTPNVTAAARAAGRSREHVYNSREADPAFAKEWDDAIEQSTDKAVGEAYRRAVKGVVKPVFGSLGGNQGSGEIGKIREYSDTLLIFLLKSHRPRTYREKIDQLNVNLDLTNLTDQQLEMLANGADIRAVLAITGESGNGAAAAAPVEPV